MKIEEGKFYRTRDGQKVGPMISRGDGWRQDEPFQMWVAGGRHCHKTDCPYDIVAEWIWTDGPVRTVTRKEIVPGVYGRVRVAPCSTDSAGELSLDWVTREGKFDGYVHTLSAAELRAAAATLTEIADALGEP